MIELGVSLRLNVCFTSFSILIRTHTSHEINISLCNCSYQTNEEKRTPFGRYTILVGHMKKAEPNATQSDTVVTSSVYEGVVDKKKGKKEMMFYINSISIDM